MADLSQLSDVLDNAFAALGARAKGSFAAMPQPPLSRQVAQYPEMGLSVIGNALGITDAIRALRGEMTPEEAERFAVMSSVGLIPAVGEFAGPVSRVVENALLKGMGEGVDALTRGPFASALAKIALHGDVHPVIPVSTSGNAATYANAPHYWGSAKLWESAGGTYAEPSFKDMPLEQQMDALLSALEEAGIQPKGTFKPQIEESDIENALTKNPGASIFDIAGVKPQDANAAYKGYTLHESSYPGDYFVHGPDGSNVAEITKMEGKNGSMYKIELSNGANQMSASPLEALKTVQSIHSSNSNISSVEPMAVSGDYADNLSPFDWQNHNPFGHQYADFDDLGVREHARSLGFNVNLPLYKGGSLSDYPSNLYIPNKKYERGLFFSDQKEIAQKYAGFGNPALQYVARAKNPMTIDWQDATGLQGYGDQMHDIIEAARAKGVDLLHVSNMEDIGGHQSQYVVLDPSILRAPTAQFNPSRLHEASPLAGLAGLSLGGGLFFDQYGQLQTRGQ